MMRRMFLGKIHRAKVTQADLDYEGSLTIDADLMEAAGIVEHEAVHLWNITQGTRLMTYALRGEPDVVEGAESGVGHEEDVDGAGERDHRLDHADGVGVDRER